MHQGPPLSQTEISNVSSTWNHHSIDSLLSQKNIESGASEDQLKSSTQVQLQMHQGPPLPQTETSNVSSTWNHHSIDYLLLQKNIESGASENQVNSPTQEQPQMQQRQPLPQPQKLDENSSPLQMIQSSEQKHLHQSLPQQEFVLTAQEEKVPEDWLQFEMFQSSQQKYLPQSSPYQQAYQSLQQQQLDHKPQPQKLHQSLPQQKIDQRPQPQRQHQNSSQLQAPQSLPQQQLDESLPQEVDQRPELHQNSSLLQMLESSQQQQQLCERMLQQLDPSSPQKPTLNQNSQPQQLHQSSPQERLQCSILARVLAKHGLSPNLEQFKLLPESKQFEVMQECTLAERLLSSPKDERAEKVYQLLTSDEFQPSYEYYRKLQLHLQQSDKYYQDLQIQHNEEYYRHLQLQLQYNEEYYQQNLQQKKKDIKFSHKVFKPTNRFSPYPNRNPQTKKN
ncbi:hypothetical protein Anas_11790 [Armadillidium nasatum]|uniref:Uncharacterized protein n=1 Tax=Armadillidium nasatum TaxID=96803 RepID=A0A5N5T3Y7_9CRUS|nr:hypothetical protein Anas_11790 [Armadillidium nasatum]